MNPFQKPHRLNIRPSIPSFINPGSFWMFRQTAYAYPCSVGNFAVDLLTETLLLSIGFSPVLVRIRQDVGSPLIIGPNLVLNDATLYEVSIQKYVLFHYHETDYQADTHHSN